MIMKYAEIPRSLQIEHEKLHDTLRKAKNEPGELGDAAQALAKLLHPHFVKEEEFALPPLGLLRPLAEGKITPPMREVLASADKLKAGLNQMLEEHKAIVAAVDRLSNAAKQVGKIEYAEFAEALMLHAQAEEEVTYPAAILVGEYLKGKV
jgi:hypothetical protein